MEREKRNKEQWLKAFIDRETDFDYDAFCKMITSPDNDNLREALHRLNRLSDLKADKAKIWKNICCQINKSSRHRIRQIFKYTAVSIAFLLSGGLWWLMHSHPEAETPASLPIATELLPGSSKAYILLSEGHRMELTTPKHDTTFFEGGMRVQLDSSGKISYTPSPSTGTKNDKIIYNTIIVPRGGEYKLELADGTLVWLNSDSELRYPVTFNGKQREVRLKGEGYFQVSPNPEKPFRVMAGEMAVKVLGTSFNVNAYQDRGNILTTLVSGKVDIQDISGNSLAVMEPDRQADFRNGKVSVKEVDAAKCVTWVNGKFYFDEMALEDIMLQLQRWYDMEVFFTDEKLKSHPFTGVIRRNLTAERTFEIIEKTTRVKFKINGKCVTIHRR